VKESGEKVNFEEKVVVSPEVKKAAISVENALYASDLQFLACKRARNDLEAYAYELRANLEPEGKF